MAKKLNEIEGISPEDIAKLEAKGITNLDQFIEAAGTKKGRESLVTDTGIPGDNILKWVNRADLSRVKGISTVYSDLLEHAGVDTVPELAQRRPDNLLAKMTEINSVKHLATKMPTESMVADWVAQAKELPRAIHY
jgi:predicted flap endonuclease-1-like 5' DNA nuclease